MAIKTYKEFVAAGKPELTDFLRIGDTADYALVEYVTGTHELEGKNFIQDPSVYDILGDMGVNYTFCRCGIDGYYWTATDAKPFKYTGLCRNTNNAAEWPFPEGIVNKHPRAADKVYVCSPYRGDGNGDYYFHIRFASAICRFLYKTRGAMPLATHLFFPNFLNDKNRQERDWALEAGRMIIEKCDYVYCACLGSQVPSSGMEAECNHAANRGIPVEYCYYSNEAGEAMILDYLDGDAFKQNGKSEK